MADWDEYRRVRSAVVDPLSETAAQANECAASFAKVLLGNLFLVAGGAFVAIPAYASLLEHLIGVRPNLSAVIWSLSLSLGSTFLAVICGFFSEARRADHFNEAALKNSLNIDDSYQRRTEEAQRGLPAGSITRAPATQRKIDKHDAQAQRHWKWRQWFRGAGIAFAVIALACLLYALVRGALLLGEGRA
jgi:hypothetical protein